MNTIFLFCSIIESNKKIFSYIINNFKIIKINNNKDDMTNN